MLESMVMWIVHTVGQLGYTGIVALMFLESSFFPFPSEVVIPPAGYLAAQGQMSLVMVIVCGIVGSLLGALFNYWLAARWGRTLFIKYGRYVFLKESGLEKAERFFERHGHISMFVGRLLPGIRQYISLPAGLGRMNLGVFSIFTAAGAGIWVFILAFIGYWVGNNPDITRQYLHRVGLGLIFFSVVLIGLYVWKRGIRPQGDGDAHSGR